MAYGTRATFNAIREMAFGDLLANFDVVGTLLTDHARIVRFTNTTDVEVYISLDGATDQIRMAVNSFFLLDFSTNKVQDDGLFVPVGTIFYARRVAGAASSGAIWIEVVAATGGV